MESLELATIPAMTQLVEAVATEAAADGNYPAIFDNEHLPETIHRIITASGLPYATRREYRHVLRQVSFAVGRHLQAHHVI